MNISSSVDARLSHEAGVWFRVLASPESYRLGFGLVVLRREIVLVYVDPTNENRAEVSGYRLQRDDASGLQGLRCPFLPGSAGLTSATQVGQSCS